ncbi:hypothetical protein T492DRAFT_925371 [Pavlovales sp. CCMP2436]|nr:hypothetical protein T492DRAFT_925371 [Pavlovales sp. CCMP2436]
MADTSFDDEIRSQFYEFIKRFSSESLSMLSGSGAEPALKDYVEQVLRMVENDRSTLYVDFKEVEAFDPSLAAAIEEHFFRLEPALRGGLRDFVSAEFPAYAQAQRDFHVAFFGMPFTMKIRDATKTENIGKLSCVSGTVTRTSEVRPELVEGVFACGACSTLAEGVKQQFRYTEPMCCAQKSCTNRTVWTLDVKRSKFADWQRVRVQENTSEIPAGCMPRTLDVIVRDENVERAKAGDKAVFTGSLVVSPDVLGMQTGQRTEVRSKQEGRGADAGGVSGLSTLGVRELAYKTCFLASSLSSADARFGDINIRDEGDDEEAVKATFNTAALDEIEEMRAKRTVILLERKRCAPSAVTLILFFFNHVAIHEAMEQQTISIAKAGIRATLNARASILAAANPTHGRYDRSKPLSKNLSLGAPIMSRFDLFFVILDECNEVTDHHIAKHIVNLHQHGSLAHPTMTEPARAELIQCYSTLRAESHGPGSTMAQRITVRQLEAMIRLSEAIARVHLDETIKVSYVRQAYRLLRKSVVHVQHPDVEFDEEGAFLDEVLAQERHLVNLVIGRLISKEQVIVELPEQTAVDKADRFLVLHSSVE